MGDSRRGGGAPPITDAVSISCGESCAVIKKDGTLVHWGDSRTVASPPAAAMTNVVSVSCGGHACTVIKDDGNVVAWGIDHYGNTSAGGNTKPVTNMASMECGHAVCAGIYQDTGGLVAFGDGRRARVPGDTEMIQVSCGSIACVGLKKDRTLIVWGEVDSNEGLLSVNNLNVPAEGITDIVYLDCGFHACAALKEDGTVVSWGMQGWGGDRHLNLTGANMVTCGFSTCAAFYSEGKSNT